MKYYILILLISIQSHAFAETFKAKYYDKGAKGTTPLEIKVQDGWQIVTNDNGDYLITDKKTVYFTASLFKQNNDEGNPITLADFEASRKFESSQKQEIKGKVIYTNFRGTASQLDAWAFSIFIKTGYTFYATMIPYPEYKSVSVNSEYKELLEMLSTIQFNITD